MEFDSVYGYSGEHRGTVLRVSESIFAYPIGSNIVLESAEGQEFLRGHDEEVTIIANAGDFIASGQLGSRVRKLNDASVFVWSISRRECIFQIGGLAGRVSCLAFSADGRFLAAAGENQLFVIYDLQSGESIYSKHTEAVISVLVFGDISNISTRPSYVLYLSQDSAVFLARLSFDVGIQTYAVAMDKFNMGSGHLSRRYTCGTVVGKDLLLGTQTGDMCVFTTTGQVFRAAMPLFSGRVGWLLPGRQADSVVAGGADGVLKILTGSDTLWDLKHEAKISTSAIVAIAADPLSSGFLVGVTDGCILKTSETLQTGAEVAVSGVSSGVNALVTVGSTGFVLALNSGEVAHWSFNSSGGRARRLHVFSGRGKAAATALGVLRVAEESACEIVAGFSDGSCRVLRFAAETTETGFWQSHRGGVTSVAVGETFVVTGGADGAVRVWQRDKWSVMACQYAEHRGAVMNVAVDVNMRHLVHSVGLTDHLVITYDLKTNRPVVKHQSRADISLAGLSQRLDHEQELITGTSDGRLLFWDVDYAEPVAELVKPASGKITAVSTSPSGRYVAASGASAPSIAVFDLKTGACETAAAVASVTAIAWTADERQIVFGCADKTVGVLNFFATN